MLWNKTCVHITFRVRVNVQVFWPRILGVMVQVGLSVMLYLAIRGFDRQRRSGHSQDEGRTSTSEKEIELLWWVQRGGACSWCNSQ